MQSDFSTQLDMSIAFHPQMDGQLEWTIQVSKCMHKVLVMHFSGQLC